MYYKTTLPDCAAKHDMFRNLKIMLYRPPPPPNVYCAIVANIVAIVEIHVLTNLIFLLLIGQIYIRAHTTTIDRY